MEVYLDKISVGEPIVSPAVKIPRRDAEVLIYGVPYKFPFIGNDGIMYENLDQLIYRKLEGDDTQAESEGGQSR